MFSVDSTVKLNFGKLDALSDNAVTALEMTADALLSELKNAQVMPKDTGNLQNENTFVDDSQSQRGVVILSSSTPYARRLYYHPEFINVNSYTIKRGKRAGQTVKGYTATSGNFKKTYNANAQDHWLKFWLPGGKRQNFCREKFKEIYKELCGL